MASTPPLSPAQRPMEWVPGVNWRGHEANHVPPSHAEFKNAWSYTSTPPYVFMAWCVTIRRDNFRSLLQFAARHSTVRPFRVQQAGVPLACVTLALCAVSKLHAREYAGHFFLPAVEFLRMPQWTHNEKMEIYAKEYSQRCSLLYCETGFAM
jgi:hypothetical protein